MRSEKQIYHAAIYLRLSRDDEDKVESDSINNQRELLKSYIDSQLDIELLKEFSDDGYTGTNFDRPGFQKMMKLVEQNIIDCVIVKDLSRLGRNYIETGRYIDQIFPNRGVRFISVNDNYDSAKEFNDADQIIIPFKNLINDAYCRDISMKVRSQLDTKRKNGKFIGSFAAYGYKKDPADKNHLIVDENAAEVVKLIFNWRLEGASPGRIADKLNAMGVLPPMEYKRSQGLNFNSALRSSDIPKWYHGNVAGILRNELYIGTIVQGKKRKINYKLKEFQDVAKEEWIRVPNMHEPIITKEVFERVQKLDKTDMRVAPTQNNVRLFSGFVKCADCGQNMIIRKTRRGKKVFTYYICSSSKDKRCTSHSINALKLEKAVTEAVQKQVQTILDFDKLGRLMDHKPLEAHRIKALEKQLEALDIELDRNKELKEKVYEDYKERIIDEDDYTELKARFESKIEQAKQARMEVERKKDNILNEPLIPPDWVSEIRKFGEVSQLTRKMVVMLIDEIIVYSKNEIEIRFHYGDEMATFAEAIGKDPIDTRREVS